ncbi:disks large-associated protein 5 isoform X2 [Engystomops pustulosus]|uniref:disks large-associated protein 5 isoform X2 n=1 Tax=Engystomops pustulosus TaxID=76066 RepID=UPI003AFA7ED9
MDVRSQFAGRYKKDMSVENLRAKVARRKSISQKENRHKEFRKSRGLALADVNVSLARDRELTVVEEGNESCLGKGPDNQLANQSKTKEQIIKEERRAMLQRFKEEKQLRKLKEQREKASKGVFKCGIYKPEISLIPNVTKQTTAKVKPQEKPPTTRVTRVTRSAAKPEPPTTRTRAQANVLTNKLPVEQANVLTHKLPVERTIPKGRGQTSLVKKNESKVSAIPTTRTTRSAANAISKLPTATKVKTAAVSKPQKTTKEAHPEIVIEPEPPVIDQSNDEVQKPDPEPLQETSPECPSLAEPLLLQESSAKCPSLSESVEHVRKPSFAPENFVFQPLDGLSSFMFQPMTPNRANAFLTPTFTWSPLNDKRSFVFSREHKTEENQPDLVSPSEPTPMIPEVVAVQDLNVSPEDKECSSDANSAKQVSPAVSSPPCEQSMEDNKTTQPEEPTHDVPYFRDILKSEIQKLTLLCADWDKRIEMDIPEDAKDLIRTTVGQTRLLMTERFKQFEGLVDNCEFKRGEKETTCTDLEGFWDMIYFQIEDVGKKFVNLGKLEENSWQQNTVQTKKVVRKKSAPVAAGKQSAGDTGRAAARSRLAAIKAAMKNRVKTEEPIAEVEAPIIPMQVDPVVFDAGFFRIESPAKLPGSLRTKRSSSQTNTPKSTQKIVKISATPITNGVEESAEDPKPEKCPSPAKSPVRKALFGIEDEESLQHQESDPTEQCPENTETEPIPAEVDLSRYLVPTQTVVLGAEESPGPMKSLDLAASETTQDGCETDLETGVDDVFMSSPEKFVPTAETSYVQETSEPVPNDDLKTTSDPLDFLGNCTPILAQDSPMRVETSAALTDLIMFSPMEK